MLIKKECIVNHPKYIFICYKTIKIHLSTSKIWFMVNTSLKSEMPLFWPWLFKTESHFLWAIIKIAGVYDASFIFVRKGSACRGEQ